MISADKELQKALAHYERFIGTKIYIKGIEKPIDSGIKECTITEQGFSSSRFTIGEFNTNSLDLSIYSDKLKENQELRVVFYIEVNGVLVDVEMGAFYISEIERNDNYNALKIKAYDISYKLNETYVSNIDTFPTTAKKILEDISTQYDIKIDYNTLKVGDFVIEEMYDCTVKEMLGFIAQLQCSNVKIDRVGTLKFYWYEEVEYTIGRDLQTLDGFTKTSDDICEIDGINCTTRVNGEEVTYTVGTGVIDSINISNPYMTQELLNTIYDTVKEFRYTPCKIEYRGNPTLEIGDVVKTIDSNGKEHRVLLSEHTLVLTALKGTIECKYENEVSSNASSYSPTEGKINAVYNFVERFYSKTSEIENLYAQKAEINTLLVDYATIEHLTSHYVDAQNLRTQYMLVDFGNISQAAIDTLATNEALIKNLSTKYADIDFANIGDAAIKKIFSDYGIINNLTIQDGQVTGSLSAITINGDLIEAGTLKADKLMVKGTDGKYYNLNLDGMGASVSVVPEDQIHGKTIVAKSITAEKVFVNDLVAFGATIGGFNITNNSIYSGSKASVDSKNTGIYLDSLGQLCIGDESNELKYYKDGDVWKLNVSASSINVSLGENYQSLESALNSLSTELSNTRDSSKNDNERLRSDLENNLYNLQTALESVNASLNGLELNFSNNVIHQESVNAETDKQFDLIEKYIRFVEGNIVLGTSDSKIKAILSNEKLAFTKDGSEIAYISNDRLYITNAEILSSLKLGKFAFIPRNNGNLSFKKVG